MLNDIVNTDIQELIILLIVTILYGSYVITLLPKGVLLPIEGVFSHSNCSSPLTTAEDHLI